MAYSNKNCQCVNASTLFFLSFYTKLIRYFNKVLTWLKKCGKLCLYHKHVCNTYKGRVMTDNISSKRAFDDLSAIRKTIDATTGARIFNDAIFSMGTLMIITGILVDIMCGVNFYALEKYGSGPTVIKWMIIMWVCILFCTGIAKWIIFTQKSKKLGMSVWQYVHQAIKGSFLAVDLPLELAATFTFVLAFKLGHPEYIIPAIAMFIGIIMAIIGSVFSEKSLTVFGYIYIILGGTGLLFFIDNLFVYVGIVYGIFFVIIGLLMHIRYKQLRTEYAEEMKDV